ncbi:MAG: molybdopterin oxidoreductase family protein [Gammaproteobacteria bacterium]|nr:molybdopterin oxidoreductase family protein [Gammaproteobacteria bacterium]
MSQELHPSVCPHDCPSACALEVERIDQNTIGRIHGAKTNSYTQGVICAKVARYAERVHHPDRLLRPLKRVGAKGSGRFVPISWDEALDSVAERLLDIASNDGPEAVWPYYYGGTMGQVQRDGINRLRHVMGYSGMAKTICVAPAYAGWNAGTGAGWGADPREMQNSDLIVIWGCNAVATQVNVMTLVSQARTGRHAKLVVVDPDLTPTARKADLHLQLKPGTDGALACAVMQQLFAKGFADRAYLAKYTDRPAELESHLATRTPSWAAQITGLPVAQIEQFAELYGRTQHSFIRVGLGFSRSRNGAFNLHAVSCLPAITGAWQYPGGGALLGSSGLFHLDKRLIEGLDALRPEVRILDMSRIGAILCGESEDLQGGVEVKALLIQSTNPMAVAPDLNRVRRGFSREDLFVCVHEQFLTETAEMADIVLPATTFLEHTDLYQTYGQVHLQLARPVIVPPGECRSNHQVICDLARRLGAQHPGFDMNEEALIDSTLKASGYPDFQALAEMRWLDCSKPFAEMNFLNGFSWPDGRFRFAPDWGSLGPLGANMPRLPDHWEVIDSASPEHPFRLITPPAHNFLNTSFSETPSSIAKERQPRVRIHPDDAMALGIVQESLVRVGNRQGEVLLEASLDPGLPPGVIAVDGIWPGSAFANGQGINSLVSADPVAPAGGAAFHDTAVWVRLATEEL